MVQSYFSSCVFTINFIEIKINDVRKFIFILIVPIFLAACSKENNNPTDFNVLQNLPADSGGVQKAYPYESTDSPYGFYAYTPSGYSADGPEYPLLVFLHGSGEKGNSAADPAKLDLVLRNGPPMLIKKNQWSPTYPMIVTSPQCHDGGWNAQKIHEFIKYVRANFRVNTKRIYVTGLSMGGYGTFSYIGEYGDDSYAAACVPICGGGNTGKAENFMNVPIWIFHGDADGTVPVNNSIKMADAINALNPQLKAKLTIYPGVGHNSWSITYDGTGMGRESRDFDDFSMSVYDWMFQYQKEFPVDPIL
jgi:predicted peptidase